MTVKLISWNVNGLRAVLKKGFLDFVAEAKPDILCLQETRALPEQVELPLQGYAVHWHPAEKKGYSGVATLSHVDPLAVRRGIGVKKLSGEGRVLTLEFSDYFVVNCYTPNSGRELARLEYRTKEWDPAFRRFVKKLAKIKPVIFCGDLNVAHKEIDLARPKDNVGNAGFTPEERKEFDRLLRGGFVDTFREFHEDGGHYTWWSYMSRAREKNIGWRIDYFCISPELRPRLGSASILPDVMGSDHCPVVMELNGK